jgi:hypothetical protein
MSRSRPFVPMLSAMQISPSGAGGNQGQAVADEASVDMAHTAMSLERELADKLLSSVSQPPRASNSAPVPSGSTYAVYA